MMFLSAAAAAPIVLPKIAYFSILPELILIGGAVAILGVGSLLRRRMEPGMATTMAVFFGLVSLAFSITQWIQVQKHGGHGAHVAIAGSVVQDGFSAFISILVSCAVVVSALVFDGWIRREDAAGAEFQALMMISAAGAIVMGSANDLIVVFLGLEILSIALYVLAAFNAKRSESGEAALKYFVLGAFSSAVFLYGVALVYGATGTTNLPQIADYLARNIVLHNGMLLAGLALLLVGFGFKIAAVPFHLWTPDVYQGSPSPVTGFMAAVAKAGGFAALLRVFISSFGVLRGDWQPAVWVLAAITLVLGAVVAFVQRDIKRMMAYSSINHAGFVLLGLQAATARGVEGSLYYLFVYTFMVIGTFAVISVVGGAADGNHDIENYRGLSKRNPWLAGSLAVLLVAQAGIPFTTGFLAKLEVIAASVGAHSTALAIVAMVTAAIAAFFYLRVVLVMYSGYGENEAIAGIGPYVAEPSAVTSSAFTAVTTVSRTAVRPDDLKAAIAASIATPEALTPPASVMSAIFLCVATTIFFGVWPSPLLDFAHRATLLFH